MTKRSAWVRKANLSWESADALLDQAQYTHTILFVGETALSEYVRFWDSIARKPDCGYRFGILALGTHLVRVIHAHSALLLAHSLPGIIQKRSPHAIIFCGDLDSPRVRIEDASAIGHIVSLQETADPRAIHFGDVFEGMDYLLRRILPDYDQFPLTKKRTHEPMNLETTPEINHKCLMHNNNVFCEYDPATKIFRPITSPLTYTNTQNGQRYRFNPADNSHTRI